MKDFLEDVRADYGTKSPQYVSARFLKLRHYKADDIADFLEHRKQIEGSSYFAFVDPFCMNPLDMGTNINIVLVTLGPCLYEKIRGANKFLNDPQIRRLARYTTLWAHVSESEKPCLDVTPNAELSDRTGTLKVISGLDIPNGRSIYSSVLAYNIKSDVAQLLDGFFTRGNGRKKERRREMGGLELATGWI